MLLLSARAPCLHGRLSSNVLVLANPEIEGSVILDGSKANENGAHQRWFIISDSLRGDGIGRQLLAEALAFSDACGYKKTCLWTFAGLEAARHLYEFSGFKLVYQSPGTQWGKLVEEQRFEREA